MKTFTFIYTDQLTEESVSINANYRSGSIQNFVMRQIQKQFTDSVEDQLKAYFGKVEVNVKEGAYHVCTAYLTTNVFGGRTEGEFHFASQYID